MNSRKIMHKLLINNSGEKLLLLGNEAIARGAVEAGVALLPPIRVPRHQKLQRTFFRFPRKATSILNIV
jgi:indolepyruvate ferredoxin oxidoreductase alpha subunit